MQYNREIKAALEQALYAVSTVRNLIEDDTVQFNSLVEKDVEIRERYNALIELLVR